jgi:hypothetical protein
MEKLQLTISLATLVGLVATAVLAIFKPNAKQDLDISTMKGQCDERHKRIDENIKSAFDDLKLIKENHLRHIESDIGELKNTQTKIMTILDERLPRREA